MSRRSQQEQEVAQQILGYFLRNSQAADNLEGVVRWRLLDERVHLAVEHADRALEWLVNQGYLQASVTASAGRVFRLHAARRADAEKFVSGSPESRPVEKGSTTTRSS